MIFRCISILILCVSSVISWGPQGHEIIATYAQLTGNVDTINKYTSLLGTSLANVSNWADEVKEYDDYKWSAILHYVDTPDNLCTYVRDRDCVDEQCVTGAIRNYTQQLDDFEGVKFTIHFVGDVHQPLLCTTLQTQIHLTSSLCVFLCKQVIIINNLFTEYISFVIQPQASIFYIFKSQLRITNTPISSVRPHLFSADCLPFTQYWP